MFENRSVLVFMSFLLIALNVAIHKKRSVFERYWEGGKFLLLGIIVFLTAVGFPLPRKNYTTWDQYKQLLMLDTSTWFPMINTLAAAYVAILTGVHITACVFINRRKGRIAKHA
jgi:hypothetical protein